jgi:PhzF family phenazine biosynthesis protein
MSVAMRRRFLQVDVFGGEPFAGNPLAVVLDAEDLSTEEMQGFARWANLSESAFLLPPTSPEADYRVRIFTLARELPFAGHPTLGSCHAWLAAGGEPRRPDTVMQECGAGLVTVRRQDGRLAFSAPPLIRTGPVEGSFLEEVAAVLGIDRGDIVDAQWADNGPGWVAVLLADADAVLALEPDFRRSTGEGSLDIGVVGPYPEGSEVAFEVRAVFSDERRAMREDPRDGVTQRVAGAVAALLGTRHRPVRGRPGDPARPGRPGARRPRRGGDCLGRGGHPHLHRGSRGALTGRGAPASMPY